MFGRSVFKGHLHGRVQIADFKGMNKDQIQDIHADLRKQLEGREVAAHEARAKAAKDSQDLADLHLQLRQQLLKVVPSATCPLPFLH